MKNRSLLFIILTFSVLMMILNIGNAQYRMQEGGTPHPKGIDPVLQKRMVYGQTSVKTDDLLFKDNVEWQIPLALRNIPKPVNSLPVAQRENEYNQVKLNTDGTFWLQNEEQCAIHPLEPDKRVAVWRDFRLGYRQIGIGWSDDSGLTWHDRLLEPELQIYSRQSDPGLTWDIEGNMYLVSLDFTFGYRNALVIYRSDDGGQSFQMQGIATDQSENEIFEDKELMACDRSESEWQSALHLVWTRFDYQFGTETTIYHCVSYDYGVTWSDPQPISGHGVQWPVPCVGADGEVFVGWNSWTEGGIMFTRSMNGGDTFAPPWRVKETNVFNSELNGDILTFSYPAMDVDLYSVEHRGRIHLVHMDVVHGDADLWYLYSDDGGDNWSSARRLNEDLIGNGADQFHPWVSVDDRGQVHVIWYDRRNDLPDNYLIDLYYRMSPDGGETWGPETRITEAGFDPQAGNLRAGLLGEYLGLAAWDNKVQIAFTDTRDGNQDVWGCALTLDQSLSVDYMADWNIVGLPLLVENAEYQFLFPDAVENTLFSFDQGYHIEQELVAGSGYWLRFGNSNITTFRGRAIDEITISLSTGWNLIAGISDTISIAAINDPDGIVIPGTYYSVGYGYELTDVLEPGKGYWVRSGSNGDIHISNTANTKVSAFTSRLAGANTIGFNGNELYFGVDIPENERLSYSLPPKPPPGVDSFCDVRFVGDWKYCESSGEIEVVNNTEMLTISYSVKNEETWLLLNSVSGEEYTLRGIGEMRIDGDANRFELYKHSEKTLPVSYALYQNYPNPFNPVTTISYQLPQPSFVNLSIFNLQGRHVRTLIEGIENVGTKTVIWNTVDEQGIPVGAGIYLYRIRAGDFIQTRKLVVLK